MGLNPDPDPNVAEALRNVSFYCQQCAAIINSVTNSGYSVYGAKYIYRLRCHGEMEEVMVDGDKVRGASFEVPLLVDAFAKSTQRRHSDPHLRFYCGTCDTVTNDWLCQREPNNTDIYVFSVACHGGKCGGKRYSVRYNKKDMEANGAWRDKDGAPLIMPLPKAKISVVFSGGPLDAKAKPKHTKGGFAPPAPPILPAKVRKLRLE